MSGKTAMQLEEIEKETRAFVCPVCSTHLQFRVRVNVSSVGLASTTEEIAARDGVPVLEGAEARRKRELVENNQEFLASAKALGVFDAFNTALDAQGKHLPNHRDSYFIKWLENATRLRVPQFGIRQCLPEDDRAGDLELWGYARVAAVIADGEFRAFVPRDLIDGGQVASLTAGTNGITVKKQIDLPMWVRTRFGYVERPGEFAAELRKHSIGAFQTGKLR